MSLTLKNENKKKQKSDTLFNAIFGHLWNVTTGYANRDGIRVSGMSGSVESSESGVK